MFSENQIKAYKSISAPDELRQKILGMEKTEKKSGFKMRNIGIYAAAACLVLVVSLSGLFGGNDFTASLGGQEIGKDAVAVQPDSGIAMLDARAASELSLDIEVETDQAAEVTVSAGSVQISDYDTGEVKENAEASGKNIVRWTIINADENETYEMRFDFNRGKSTEIILEYDREAMCWTAYNK